MPQMLQVPKEEFLDLKREIVEMEERLEILMDRELISQLVKSEEAIKKGEVRSFDEVRKELGI